MGFKENVEVLLSRSHWSQRQLAAAAGISSGRICSDPRQSYVARHTGATRRQPRSRLHSASTSQTWYATQDFLLPAMNSSWRCVTKETSAPGISGRSMHSSRISAKLMQRETSMAGETVLVLAPTEELVHQLSHMYDVPVTTARSSIPQSIAEAA